MQSTLSVGSKAKGLLHCLSLNKTGLLEGGILEGQIRDHVKKSVRKGIEKNSPLPNNDNFLFHFWKV